jgi:hypothetical protein
MQYLAQRVGLLHIPLFYTIPIVSTPLLKHVGV